MLSKLAITVTTLCLVMTPVVFAETTPVESSDLTPTVYQKNPSKTNFPLGRTEKEMREKEKITTVLKPLKSTLEMKRMRENLENKLDDLKDERKKELVLKIDDKIASISSKRVAMMLHSLDQMSEVLKKIEEKATALKQGGVDTTTVDSAITNANKALKDAYTIVKAQAEKTYSLQVSDPNSVKTDVGSTVRQMESDLRTAHKAVMNAKQAIVKAAVELRKLWLKARPTHKPGDRLTPSPVPTVSTVTGVPTLTSSVTPELTLTPTPTL